MGKDSVSTTNIQNLTLTILIVSKKFIINLSDTFKVVPRLAGKLNGIILIFTQSQHFFMQVKSQDIFNNV